MNILYIYNLNIEQACPDYE